MNVSTKGGLFNTTIGTTANPLPITAFSGSTWLETKFDTETFPRVQLVCVGYAMRAMEADSTSGLKLPFSVSAPSKTPLVSITNTGGGSALQAVAKGNQSAVWGTTYGSGAAGYFEVQNQYSTNPALSVYTLGMGPGAVFTLDGPGSSAKGISVTSVSSGSLFYGSTIGSGSVFDAMTCGSGNAGSFNIYNANNASSAIISTTIGSGSALAAVTSGTGSGGSFQINNTSNSSPALETTTNGSGNGLLSIAYGTGHAGYFQISNSANSVPALDSQTNGSGSALQAINSGTGKAGNFFINNASSDADVLVSSTTGTGRAGYFWNSGNKSALQVGNSSSGNGLTSNAGGGTAVDGRSVSGYGGYFANTSTTTNNAALAAYTSGTGAALIAQNSGSGNGIVGFANTGIAVRGSVSGGRGYGGWFETTDPSNAYTALYAATGGTGNAGYFYGSNINNNSPILSSTTMGTGSAASFAQENSNATNPAVTASSVGKGSAFFATSYGTGTAVNVLAQGSAGEGLHVELNKSNNGCSAVYAKSIGTAYTLNVSNAGSSTGAGIFQIENSANNADALYARTSGSGRAAKFDGEVQVNGKLTGNGGGFMPIAFGVFSKSRGKISGSPNWSVQTGTLCYVSIDNFYFDNNATVIVTGQAGSGVGAVPFSGYIKFYDMGDDPVNFVVYKY
jgi:hypothetical protein